MTVNRYEGFSVVLYPHFYKETTFFFEAFIKFGDLDYGRFVFHLHHTPTVLKECLEGAYHVAKGPFYNIDFFATG